MKIILRILLFLVMLAATIFGARFIIKKLGPGNWKERINSQKLSYEKRVKSLEKNIERILKLHRKHIASMDSLRKSYKYLAKLSAERIKNLRVMASTQNKIANEYLKAKYVKQALKYYNLALQIYEYDAEALVNKGICYYNLGLYQNDPIEQYKEFRTAEQFYKKALAITTRKLSTTDKQWQKNALLYLSLLYRTIKEKNIDIAAAKYKQPEGNRDFLNLAIEYARQLYKIDSEHIRVLFQLGALYYMKNEPAKAKNYYMIIISSSRSKIAQKNKAKKFVNRIDTELRNPGLSR